MDGNGRWAERRGRPRLYGHVRGARSVREVVQEAGSLGIQALTLYAFSTENWSRPRSELDVLWSLLKKFLVREVAELERRKVRLRILGETEKLSPDVKEVLFKTVHQLSHGTGLQLNLAISYGSRRELARAAELFAQDCLRGVKAPSEMSEELLADYLWTSELEGLSEVDLVIRTSGEKRVSNFLLWQAAYAEYVFFDICWPDFRAGDLRRAIEEYSSRERRFGGVGKGAILDKGQSI